LEAAGPPTCGDLRQEICSTGKGGGEFAVAKFAIFTGRTWRFLLETIRAAVQGGSCVGALWYRGRELDGYG